MIDTMRTKLLAAALMLGAVFTGSDKVEANTYGCRTVDYGTYAGARCEANDGQDPDRVRVWIICSNDPHRRKMYGPWVVAGPWTNTSWRYCLSGGRLISWGYQVGA